MSEVIYPGPEYARNLQEDPVLLAIGEVDLSLQQRIIGFRVAREAYRADNSVSNRAHFAEMITVLDEYTNAHPQPAAA